jgi:hypothetical protein
MLQVGCSPTILGWNSWIGPDGNVFPRCKSPLHRNGFPEWDDHVLSISGISIKTAIGKCPVFRVFELVLLDHVKNQYTIVHLPTPELT